MTVHEYLDTADSEKSEALHKLRATILDNLPEGFDEQINYDMLGYVVPHELYPSGYHCDPSLPLPFLNLAVRKNNISFYHMGLYADRELLDWFVSEYPKHSKRKLDMGKSCIRFKKMDDIPYELIGELVTRMTPGEWISVYEKEVKRK